MRKTKLNPKHVGSDFNEFMESEGLNKPNVENALVAVSNDKPCVKAKKFLVHLNEYYGYAKCILADRVFYKDGLVMLEGVTKLGQIETSQIEKERILGFGRDSHADCIDRICVAVRGYHCANYVKYAIKVASVILDRAIVRSVEGLIDVNFDPDWLRSFEEAQQIIDADQTNLNKKVFQENINMIPEMAEYKRQFRAYEMWKSHHWFIRLTTPLKKYIKQFPQSYEDAQWVRIEAEKLGINFA